MTAEGADIRHTEQGHLIDATVLRGFARAALSLDAADDQVRDLLFEHVVKGRFHPSVVAESLRPMIDELLDTMTRADWQIIADEMIQDARKSTGLPARNDTTRRRP
jgi:hypothetical protein